MGNLQIFFFLYSKLILPCQVCSKCDVMHIIKMTLSTLLQSSSICSFFLLLVLLLRFLEVLSLQALLSWNYAIAILTETLRGKSLSSIIRERSHQFRYCDILFFFIFLSLYLYVSEMYFLFPLYFQLTLYFSIEI